MILKKTLLNGRKNIALFLQMKRLIEFLKEIEL